MSKLVKTFQFEDFKEGLKFIISLVQIVEWMNHHPKIILINPL
ncbi:MAG: hypothetical protein CBC02_010570 [Flavobacteriaceae bacterium TMED42]|nr:MAG: hypothetical protein CBC02_010570 [Flavobacteriaceae bacterium TMED42]